MINYGLRLFHFRILCWKSMKNVYSHLCRKIHADKKSAQALLQIIGFHSATWFNWSCLLIPKIVQAIDDARESSLDGL